MMEEVARVTKRPRLQDPPAAASDAEAEARREPAVAGAADVRGREAVGDQNDNDELDVGESTRRGSVVHFIGYICFL